MTQKQLFIIEIRDPHWRLYGNLGSGQAITDNPETATEMLASAEKELPAFRFRISKFIPVDDVMQGMLIPGDEHAICAAIITTDDVMRVSCMDTNEGSRGLSIADAQAFLDKFSEEISEAVCNGWRDAVRAVVEDHDKEFTLAPYCVACQELPALDGKSICEECDGIYCPDCGGETEDGKQCAGCRSNESVRTV